MICKINIGLFTLVLSSIVPSAFAATNGDYLVMATVSSNGVVLGTPTLMVVSGEDASVQVAGENGYSLSLNVTSSPNNTVLAKSMVKTSAAEINPSLLLEIGKASTVKSGTVELQLLVNKMGS